MRELLNFFPTSQGISGRGLTTIPKLDYQPPLPFVGLSPGLIQGKASAVGSLPDLQVLPGSPGASFAFQSRRGCGRPEKGSLSAAPPGNGAEPGRAGGQGGWKAAALHRPRCARTSELVPLGKTGVEAFLGAIVTPLFTLKPTDYPRKAMSPGEGPFRIKKSFRVFIWG